jgi:hypothetical protein
MDTLLESRIRQIYPTGLLREFDENTLGKDDQAARVQTALGGVGNVSPLHIALERGNKLFYALAITHTDDPTFDDWIWGMRNPEKTDWCKTSNRPYVVFWLRISRVADYYYFYYNHWKPRGDTGYMDADHLMVANEAWKQYEHAICSNLQKQGFILAPDAMLKERISFVLEEGYDEIPDDDPRWDDEDYRPPLVPTSVYQCLFGDW